jgi:hypothetical protein
VYDTALSALTELTDDQRFEQVAVAVLSARRFPGLRITGPSGDEGKDAFDRELFDGKDRVILMISLEKKWSPKLRSELNKIEKRAKTKRPAKAIFVTNRSAPQRWQTPHKTRAKKLGTELEVFDINEFVQSFQRDDLRPIAEAMLGVRPAAPRILAPAEVFLERLGKSIPGISAPLIGRDVESQQLKNLLGNTDAARLIVVDGPGGVGKTRLAVQAASELCTTLVVPAGVPLAAEAMSMVPLNAPAVVVVDDANRCPDMSGITALFADDRYDGVTVVLTCRQATTGSVLYRSGIETTARREMTLSMLTDADIDAIVRGHGIDDAAFSKAVINFSAGSPLIAHAVCEQALQAGQLTWSDVADLLEQRLEQRLLSVDADNAPRRAVAMCLAVRTSVGRAEEIAAMRGAVNRVPTSLDTIEALLDALSDAGLATTAPGHDGHDRYTLSPHLLAHVLVSTALRDDAPVKVDVPRTLGVLGRDAARSGATGHGLLGLTPLSPETQIDTGLLSAQLDVLSQACARSRAVSVGGLLRRAVFELLPEHPGVSEWQDVLALAGPVIAASPGLLDDLRSAIERTWPPAPDSSPILWWDQDPREAYVFDIRRLVGHVNTLVTRSGAALPAGAIRLLLAAAARAAEYLSENELNQLGKTIGQLAHPVRAGAEAVLARRSRVLDAVLEWIAASATPSASTTGATYDLMAWARVSVAALQPLLSPAIETFLPGFSDGNDVVTMNASVLPDDPRLADTIDAAATGIRDVMLRADVTATTGPGTTLIGKLIDLPHDLRATGRRGLAGASGPLPPYASRLLDRAATTIEEAVAARWTELPLTARHHVARQCVQRRGAMGTYRSLAQRAASGDTLAKLAVGDDELTPLLTLVPVDINDHDYGSATWNRSELRRHRAAEALAAATSWLDGIELLQSTAHLQDDLGSSPRIAFARMLTNDLDAAAADALLTNLAGRQDALPYEAELIRPLLAARPAEILTTLKQGATSIRGGEILLSAFQDADDAAKTDISALLLALIQPPPTADRPTATFRPRQLNHAAITTTAQRLAAGLVARTAPILGTGSRRLRRLLQSAPALPPAVTGLLPRVLTHPTLPSRGDHDSNLSEPGADAPDEARRVRLASAFAFEVFRSTWPGRTDTLIDIGLVSPPAVLTVVLGYLAASQGEQTSRAPLTNDQWIKAVALIERRFDQLPDDRALLGNDYETGRMIRALALNVPTELARILADRLTRPEAAGLRRPSTWRSFFEKTTAAQRTPFALALTRELRALARPLEAHHQFDLDQSVAAICTGTGGWDATLLELAAGAEADKERAVASVAQLWREPEWGHVVSTLLQSGLTSDQIAILINGIDMTSFGHDDDARIQQRRTALASLQPPDDPSVQAFVAQANQRIDDSIASLRHRR